MWCNKRRAIADDDPIGAALVKLAPASAGFAHQLGVMTGSRHLVRNGVNRGQGTKVKKTVGDGRQQGIGDQVCKAHQIGVCRGGIDHQEVDRRPDAGDGALEGSELLGFVVLDLCALGARDEAMERKFQYDVPMIGPNAPVFDIARQAPLIAVEINRCDPLAVL